MKKNYKTLGLVFFAAVLAVVTIIIFKNNNRSTLDSGSKDFAYADTAAVTKIFIAEKTGKKVTLERNEKGEWLVNGKFPARPDGVILLLKTLKYLEVKYPVGEKAKKAVIKDLASGAIKVEFYKGNEPVKFFYVGGETQDHTGTYMLLIDHESGENYETPYVMGLPGFEGYLTSRFFTTEEDWKDTKCLDFSPPQISSIKMNISRKPDSSFVIKIKEKNALEITDLNGKPLGFAPDMGAIKQYVAYMQNLHYEKLLTGMKDPILDSVRNSIPFATLSITEKSGKENQYLFFFKTIAKGQAEKYGINGDFDPDRFYMEFNNRTEIAMVQYYVFGKLLQTTGYFVPSKTVKK